MRNLRPVTDTPPRATIYLRQSNYREESISLELQEIACRDYCDRMGYVVQAVEADPGISGRTWKRPAVQRVMQALDDRETDVVVLWKWSRLSRSRKDWALAIDRADLAGGRIESATEPLDTATASGRFARGVMTEYAAFQSEQIGEQWEEVRQRRLGLGLPASGRLPYGWRWKNGGVEANPDQAPFVVEMYRRYLAGDGAAAIAQWLNATGVPGPNGAPWTRVRPLTVLDSPIHAGLIPYRGKIYQGAHTPIIDRGTWDTYQAEREGRRATGAKPRSYEHLLSSLVYCECGARMHGKGSVTAGRWYGGYLCSDTLNGHPQRAYISAKTIEPPITDWFMTFDVEAAAAPASPLDTAKRERLLREIAALEDELAELTRQHARRVIPEGAYTRAAALIGADIDRLTAENRALDNHDRARPDPAVVYRMREDWRWWEVSAQNRAVRAIVARIDLRDDGRTARISTAWGDSSAVTL